MNLKRGAKRVLISLPPFGRWLEALQKENGALRQQLGTLAGKLDEMRAKSNAASDILKRIGPETVWVPTGHFHSPIPAVRDVRTNADEIFAVPPAIRGVDLNEKRQLELLKVFAGLYPEQPFEEQKTADRRYHFENPNYSYTDAIILYCMIRHLRPRRIIEVGSGFSSCAILDVNELFFANSIACTFVEPYPQLLRSLIKDSDRQRIRVFAERLQDVDPRIFRELTASDILLIDSSHVAKTGSDVNYIIFKILPLLNPGVYVHFHDIFYPFEYPQEWVFEGRAWNEAYLLRAFLQYNRAFAIEFFSSYMLRTQREIFESDLPLCMRNSGGHIWLKKTEQDTRLDRIQDCAEPMPKRFPRTVTPARPEHLWLLGEGWHGGETDHCWMTAKAAIRMAGPDRLHQRLRIRGYNPHVNGVQLSVTVDDLVLAPLTFQKESPIDAVFPLPPGLVGRPTINVKLEVDRTYKAPNDPRTLGLMIMDIEVC